MLPHGISLVLIYEYIDDFKGEYYIINNKSTNELCIKYTKPVYTLNCFFCLKCVCILFKRL